MSGLMNIKKTLLCFVCGIKSGVYVKNLHAVVPMLYN